MQIQTTLHTDVAVLAVRGRMMSRPDVALLKTQIQRLIDNGILRMVVDLSNVKWFGASMLGVLVDGLNKTRAVGGDLYLTGVTRGVMRVLMVTHLEDSFGVLETAVLALSHGATQRALEKAIGQSSVMQLALSLAT